MCLVEAAAPAGAASAGGAALGVCVVDVASGQVHVGALLERSAARPGLCTALCRYDPVEVVAPHGALSAATLAAVGAHGTADGGGSAGAGGAVLSLVPLALAPSSAAEARALLSGSLPPAALRAAVEALWRQPDGAAAGAAACALALAMRQLQRCGLANELAPTLLFHPLDADAAGPGPGPSSGGADARARPGAPPTSQQQRQHMLLDDRALATLHVLSGALGERRGSLLAVLDGTVSAAGRRRLRQWLCRWARASGRKGSRTSHALPTLCAARPATRPHAPDLLPSAPAGP
jgi:hypothetical protein